MTNATPNQAENTRYGYKNDKGARLHITTAGADRDHVELSILDSGHIDWRSLNIPTTDAPGIALAILKAAGWPESDLSSITHHILADLRRVVEISEQFSKAAELTRRRDELAEKYFRNDYCDLQFPSHRLAIDDIMQLQDEATK